VQRPPASGARRIFALRRCYCSTRSDVRLLSRHDDWLAPCSRNAWERLGNFYTIQDLLDRGWSGLEIRLALMRVHYRMPMSFTLDGLGEARKQLGRMRECRARLVRIAQGDEPEGGDRAQPLRCCWRALRGRGEPVNEEFTGSQFLAAAFPCSTKRRR
jgi:cysteinyl-tRNA synthetase